MRLETHAWACVETPGKFQKYLEEIDKEEFIHFLDRHVVNAYNSAQNTTDKQNSAACMELLV